MITKIESARGCGYRKKGGLYLVSDGLGRECLKLPIPLTVCPCCSAGIKPTRGFTWISSELIKDHKCQQNNHCSTCPLNDLDYHKKFGLLWVGEKFYKSTAEFTREAMAHGVSRRIAQIPHDFDLGNTWILLAHRKAIRTGHVSGANEPEFIPGIFHAFKPARIEYVVTGNETAEEIERMEKRKITPVNVIRDIDTQQQFFN